MNEVEQRANEVVSILEERHPAWSFWYTMHDWLGVCFKGFCLELEPVAGNKYLPSRQYLTLKVAFPFHAIDVTIASEQISHYVKDRGLTGVVS